MCTRGSLQSTMHPLSQRMTRHVVHVTEVERGWSHCRPFLVPQTSSLRLPDKRKPLKYVAYVTYLMEDKLMTGLAFESYSEGRAHFKELLDAAESGRPALVRRDGSPSAVVDAERLRTVLADSLAVHPSVVAEAGGWSVFLPGVPVAADGPSFDEALEEMVDALREYAEDWQDHLLNAPNHRDNWALVQLISLSADDQLKKWLVGAAP